MEILAVAPRIPFPHKVLSSVSRNAVTKKMMISSKTAAARGIAVCSIASHSSQTTKPLIREIQSRSLGSKLPQRLSPLMASKELQFPSRPTSVRATATNTEKDLQRVTMEDLLRALKPITTARELGLRFKGTSLDASLSTTRRYS